MLFVSINWGGKYCNIASSDPMIIQLVKYCIHMNNFSSSIIISSSLFSQAQEHYTLFSSSEVLYQDQVLYQVSFSNVKFHNLSQERSCIWYSLLLGGILHPQTHQFVRSTSLSVSRFYHKPKALKAHPLYAHSTTQNMPGELKNIYCRPSISEENYSTFFNFK